MTCILSAPETLYAHIKFLEASNFGIKSFEIRSIRLLCWQLRCLNRQSFRQSVPLADSINRLYQWTGSTGLDQQARSALYVALGCTQTHQLLINSRFELVTNKPRLISRSLTGTSELPGYFVIQSSQSFESSAQSRRLQNVFILQHSVWPKKRSFGNFFVFFLAAASGNNRETRLFVNYK